MGESEALNFFNEELGKLGKTLLPNNYTEEELRKAHRIIAVKYHPNTNFEDVAPDEEMCKKLNEAYSILTKKPEENNIDNLKREYINKLGAYKYESLDEDTKNVCDKINSLIGTKMLLIILSNNKGEILEIFNSFKLELKEIYINFVESFYKKYAINAKEVKESLNYDCNFADFYKKLLRIKKQYSPYVKIDNAILEYMGWTDNDDLKELIGNAAKNAKINLRKGMNIDSALKEMEKEVKDIFEIYYRIEARIRKARESATSVSSISKCNDIYASFKNGKALADIEKMLDELEKEIENEKIIDAQRIEMNKIYAFVMQKASNRLQETKPERDALFFYVQECIIRVSNIFSYAYQNIVDMALVKELEKLTFKDKEIDNKIFNLVESTLVPEKAQHVLYVRISDLACEDYQIPIWMILEKNESYKMVEWTSIEHDIKEVSEEKLASDFIPFDIFLNDEHLRWRAYQHNTQKIYALYGIGNRDLAFRQFARDVVLVENLENMSEDIRKKDLDCFKDAEYLKNYIIRQINSDLARDNEAGIKR